MEDLDLENDPSCDYYFSIGSLVLDERSVRDFSKEPFQPASSSFAGGGAKSAATKLNPPAVIHTVWLQRTLLREPSLFAMKECMTAACCIIGDEILNGKVQDSNSHFLVVPEAKFLFELGIELRRVEMVSDDVDAIGTTVRRLSSTHDLVFTSGGIGVTHDDISYRAIAAAYGLDLRLDADTYKRIQVAMEKRGASEEHRQGYARLAMLPWPAELLRPKPELMIPVVVVNHNIYILPGVPKFFEMLTELLRDHFVSLMASKDGRRFYRAEVATKANEINIAATLASIQDRVQGDGIKIGSYPLWGDAKMSVVVSIVGKDVHAVKAVAAEIAKQIDGWEYHSARL